MRARVLYLTYDGLTDPLGQSQVLPYLEGLAALGHHITILSCEKSEALAARREIIAARCASCGLDWQPLPYRKRPLVISTALDLAMMALRARAIIRRERIDILHCRSYLTALIGHGLTRRHGASLLFDMRGFWIDERFERGIWPVGNALFERIAGFLRGKERAFFREADAVVSLTHAAIDRIAVIAGEDVRGKITVIPCCADLDHFDPRGGDRRGEGRAMIGIGPETPLLAYVGSVGGAYPVAPMIRLFECWAEGRDDSKLLFITRQPPDDVLAFPEAKAVAERLLIRAAERDEVPPLLAAADAGVSFILPSPCAIASSPTKLGEMLAMGLPVAANDGVGDTRRILDGTGAGAVAADLSDDEVDAVADALRALPNPRTAPRAVAEQWFSLERGVESYDRIYRALAED